MQNWVPRLRQHFGNAVIDKNLLGHCIPGIPTYISEAILCQYLTECPPEVAIARYREAVQTYVPTGSSKDTWHHRLQTEGAVNAIARYRVEVNVERNAAGQTLKVPALGINKGTVDSELLRQHPRLLTSGIWALGKLALGQDGVHLTKLHSFVISKVDLQQFCEGRRLFSESEWVDILTSSQSLDARVGGDLSRLKLLRLCRLAPLVQELLFMAEFGAPGTGKTYLYDQLATHAFVVSGSQATPAQMFYNLKDHQPGLLAEWPCLVLDEIDKVPDRELSDELVNKLLKFMESGEYDRGKVQVPSTASIVFSGNLPKRSGVGGAVFSGLARKLQHPAFLDRLCGVLPGWEFPVLGQRKDSVSSDWGFTADFLSQVLLELRRQPNPLAQRIRLDAGATVRDEKAIKKLFEALTKLVFPHGEATDEQLQKYLDLAVELRQIVIRERYSLHHEPSDFRQLRAHLA